jgi:hypothetical protein
MQATTHDRIAIQRKEWGKEVLYLRIESRGEKFIELMNQVLNGREVQR